MNVCSRPEDGFRCQQGVQPPLKLKLKPFTGVDFVLSTAAIKLYD